MFRRISETFTASHFTMLAMTAIIVPSALYGAVSYQAVAVTDPNTGSKVWVDPRHAAYVNDPIVGYANDPGTLARVEFNAFGSISTACSLVYTIPAGKALVLRAMTGFIVYDNSNSGYTGAGVRLSNDSNCISTFGYFYTSTPGSTSMNVHFGVGEALPAGTAVYARIANSQSSVLGLIHGYLVPAATVPAPSTLAAAETNPAPKSQAAAFALEGRAHH